MNLETVLETEKAKVPAGVKRSGEWPKARAVHLAQFPTCAVCGGTEKVEVHHIHPFHLHPDLELDPANFITLCEANKDGVDCHLFFGHLSNFKSFNADVVTDAATWNAKIKNRPLAET
ncbi:MAG: HNH endonuclease [Acidithiobacillus sp.]|nr:HNH endonuclease [Acidithiobacillus sp.]